MITDSDRYAALARESRRITALLEAMACGFESSDVAAAGGAAAARESLAERIAKLGEGVRTTAPPQSWRPHG